MNQKIINHCTKHDHQDTDPFSRNSKLDGGPCEGDVEDKGMEHKDRLYLECVCFTLPHVITDCIE